MTEFSVLRALTSDDSEKIAHHGRPVERHYPHVSTPSRCIPDHSDGIPNAAVEVGAFPYVETLGREMVTEVGTLCIGCALDPDVEVLGETLDIPVIGASANVAAVAFAHNERVGVLDLESGTELAIRDPFGDRLTVEEVIKDTAMTNYLTTDEGRATIRAAVNCFIDAGCDVVVLSCIGISLSDTILDARAGAPIPIADPVVVVGAVATIAIAPPHPPRR